MVVVTRTEPFCSCRISETSLCLTYCVVKLRCCSLKIKMEGNTKMYVLERPEGATKSFYGNFALSILTPTQCVTALENLTIVLSSEVKIYISKIFVNLLLSDYYTCSSKPTSQPRKELCSNPATGTYFHVKHKH